MPISLLDAIDQLKQRYDQLAPSNVRELLVCYASNAVFKDPFQEVRGHDAIEHIFQKMFKQLDHPQFSIREQLIGEHQIAFLWDFRFSMKRWNTQAQTFAGVSWLSFDEDFLVVKHEDFWDPAAGIYEHLPLLGPVMRGLKKRA